MREDRDALIAHYRATRAEMLAAIERLSAAQLTERTHNGWGVKDHLAHLAFWDELRAAEVLRISAGHASTWRISPEEDGVVNEIVTRARWDLALEQVQWEFAESRRRFIAALEAAPPEALDTDRYGEAGLKSGHEEEHARWIAEWRAERGY